MHFRYFLCPVAADPRPAQPADEADDDHEPDRATDIDEERDFADQGPLTDMDMEEDTEILGVKGVDGAPSGSARAGQAAQREQDQGGRDEEASQRGRCRSGGCERQRQSVLNTGL